jgi:hypothetical protein
MVLTKVSLSLGYAIKLLNGGSDGLFSDLPIEAEPDPGDYLDGKIYHHYTLSFDR